MKKTNKKGFTLVELLVVVVIIGVLAAVIVPNVTSSIDKANKSAAEQNATSAYKSLVSSLDLKTETLPEQMFFLTEKYVILIKDGSLDTSFTKEIDDTITVPKLYGSANDTYTINGKSVAANDIVVLQDGTIVRKQNGQWIDYPLMISDGKAVDASFLNAITFAKRFYNNVDETKRNPAFYYSDGNNVIYIDSNGNYDEAKSIKNAYIPTNTSFPNSNDATNPVTVVLKNGSSSTVTIDVNTSILLKSANSDGSIRFVSYKYAVNNNPEISKNYKWSFSIFQATNIDAWAN